MRLFPLCSIATLRGCHRVPCSLEMLPRGDHAGPDETPGDRGDRDGDDPIVEPAAPTQVAVVQDQAHGQRDDREEVVGQDTPGTDLDGGHHRRDRSPPASRHAGRASHAPYGDVAGSGAGLLRLPSGSAMGARYPRRAWRAPSSTCWTRRSRATASDRRSGCARTTGRRSSGPTASGSPRPDRCVATARARPGAG